MEQSVLNIISKGDPLSIVALLACIAIYVVIRYQRKNTAESRDTEIATLTSGMKNLNSELEKTKNTVDNLQISINELETEKKLLQKDVEFIKAEHTDIKTDIKEMKNTLNTMALSLERIAAKYDNDSAPTTKKG
jgi:peptidoglycan hydrolase CwlO-like protein